jgi:hypothetical protein
MGSPFILVKTPMVAAPQFFLKKSINKGIGLKRPCELTNSPMV